MCTYACTRLLCAHMHVHTHICMYTSLSCVRLKHIPLCDEAPLVLLLACLSLRTGRCVNFFRFLLESCILESPARYICVGVSRQNHTFQSHSEKCIQTNARTRTQACTYAGKRTDALTDTNAHTQRNMHNRTHTICEHSAQRCRQT